MSDDESYAIYEADKEGMERYVQEHLITLKPMIFACQVHAMAKLGKILKSFFDELHYNYGDPLPWILALAKRINFLWQPSDEWTTDEDV